MEPAIDLFLRDVFGNLDIENNLDVFHKCAAPLLIA